MTYIPPEGIDGRFYPYAVMDNYHQPIVSASFLWPTPICQQSCLVCWKGCFE